MTEEIWKSIEGFDGYDISSLGLVRTWFNKGPGRLPLKVPRLLKGSLHRSKTDVYLRVTLSIDRKKYTKRIHHLVLENFVSKRPKDKWGLHNDGNVMNNTLDNLRWGTPLENARDRDLHGKSMNGSLNHKAKLSEEDVQNIRELYKTGNYIQQELGDLYGVSQAQISEIILYKSWSNHQNEHKQ